MFVIVFVFVYLGKIYSSSDITSIVVLSNFFEHSNGFECSQVSSAFEKRDFLNMNWNIRIRMKIIRMLIRIGHPSTTMVDRPSS